MRSLVRSLGALTVAAALGVAASAPAAGAPVGGADGNTTENGYGVSVDVQLSGDVSPARRASVPGPPPACWWKPVMTLTPEMFEDPTDIDEVWEMLYQTLRPEWSGVDGLLDPTTPIGGSSQFEEGRLQDLMQRLANGEPATWYQLQVRPDIKAGTDATQRIVELGCSRTYSMGGTPSYYQWEFFLPGQVPEPIVDPETLAEYAFEVMDLVSPALDWNPRVGQIGGGTLVNLPTWLWVQDRAAVSQRSVTASAAGISATVTADTDGLSVTSPGGTTQCSADQAATRYAPSVAESGACTLAFFRASNGYPDGFPVDASTVWNATWTSSIGEGGTLTSRSVAETSFVPVAESQALVARAG